MGEIKDMPKNWEVKKLGEFIIKGGGSINPVKFENEEFELFSIPAYDIGTPEIRKGREIGSTKKIVNQDDVLLSRIVPHIQRSWVVPQSLKLRQIGSSEWIIFRGKSFTPKFLRYFLLSHDVHQQIMKTISGVGGSLTRANPNLVALIDFPLPPLPEQVAIVAKIEELFSELDHSKQQLVTAQRQLKVYRQSLLKWAFEGRLTHQNVKEGELPEGWTENEIKMVCSNIKVGIVIKPTDFYSKDGKGIKAFRSANVRELRINDSDWVYFTEEANEINFRTKLKNGDVLLVRSGYPGTSCVVPKEFEGCNAIDILIATPNREKILPEYLCYFNNSPLGKGLFLSKSRGVAQKHLNVGEYSKLKIYVPSLNEQYKIISVLDSKITVCDNMEETISQSLLQIEALRQSILKKAFEGKLT